MMEKQKIEIDISIQSLLKIVLVYFIIIFLWQIKDIIILFFIVLVIVAAISPIVDNWSKKMNRVAAIALVYLILVTIISLISIIVFPPLIGQIQQLSGELPSYFSKNIPILGLSRDLLYTSQEGLSSIASELSQVGGRIFTATIGVFGGLVAGFTVIVLSFYLLLEEQGAKKFILKHLPIENREKIVLVFQKIGLKMGAWLRGQIMLGLIIGLIDGFGLGLLGVNFALTLGVWAGVTELIPYIGPVLGAVPAVIIAFAVSPIIGILTLALYVVVQQIEANFLVPKIMQKAVGLSPVIIILAILTGAKVAGLIGVVLAIPAAAAIGVIIEERSSLVKIIKRS